MRGLGFEGFEGFGFRFEDLFFLTFSASGLEIAALKFGMLAGSCWLLGLEILGIRLEFGLDQCFCSKGVEV